jgi:hypothetical protein
MLPSLLDDNHPALALLPDAPNQEQIERFGELIQSLEGEHGVIDISTMHHHAEGLYGRSVVIKAGTFLVGLPHKAGHLNVCVGDVTVWTTAGKKRLTGAHILPAEAGVMRVGFAHRDTTWFSVHRNDTGSTHIELIENALIDKPALLLTRRTPAFTFNAHEVLQ